MATQPTPYQNSTFMLNCLLAFSSAAVLITCLSLTQIQTAAAASMLALTATAGLPVFPIVIGVLTATFFILSLFCCGSSNQTTTETNDDDMNYSANTSILASSYAFFPSSSGEGHHHHHGDLGNVHDHSGGHHDAGHTHHHGDLGNVHDHGGGHHHGHP